MTTQPHHETLYGDGEHDDAPAFNAIFRDEPVWVDGELKRFDAPCLLPTRTYRIATTIKARPESSNASGQKGTRARRRRSP